jgi:hypothetical protein
MIWVICEGQLKGNAIGVFLIVYLCEFFWTTKHDTWLICDQADKCCWNMAY